MSDKPSAVAAVAAVMASVRSVGKEGWNEAQKFKFRGIDAVVNAVAPALREHGVVILPVVQNITVGTVDVGSGTNRRPIGHVLVTVAYRFYGPAGDYLEAVAYGEAMDSGDKATAKAMSVAFRTCLLQTLALPTDDPDPDTQTYERAAEDSRHLEPLDPSKLQRIKGNPGQDQWQQPDAHADLKKKVWNAAKKVGVSSRETLEADYAQYTQGMILADADDLALAAYLTHLEHEAAKAEQSELAL